MAYTTIDNPELYFNTVIYSGNGGTQSITSLDFQPDFLWGKQRNVNQDHVLLDSIRGTTKQLYSSDSAAEQTNTTGVTSFNSDGFSLGSSGYFNNGSNTYVAWNWLAGGSASSNSDGSITSTVSANTTSGFSIVSYTGTGANATVGHGLGVAPAMIIVKSITTVNNWRVGHNGLTDWTYKLNLESDVAESSQANVWNSTAPTSSVFSIGSSSSVNASGQSFIAYCFAEKKGFSKFGSYTGNGNADGTFVYTGFKPAFLIIKKSSAIEDWGLIDNKRDPNNDGTSSQLFPNTNGAEDTSNDRADFLSNGFKLRTSSGQWNTSGGTYIYMAFAENPFVTSTGVPATAR